ncbi:MAG: fumarylacetoacetate hydrolase family protein [Pseudomonadota bacterium]
MTQTGSGALLAQLIAAHEDDAQIGQPAARPASLEEAYRIADRLAQARSAAVGGWAGWKVGATSAPAQKFLGVTEPIRGRMPRSGIVEAPISVAARPGLEAEPEIILRLKDDFDGRKPPRTTAEAYGMIDEARVGVELVRPAYAAPFDAGALCIVADNAAHQGLVLGPAMREAERSALDEIAVALTKNGQKAGEGVSSVVLDHPLNALVWLARSFAATEEPLAPGSWVATGSICRAVSLEEGDYLVADFGAAGRVEITAQSGPPRRAGDAS